MYIVQVLKFEVGECYSVKDETNMGFSGRKRRYWYIQIQIATSMAKYGAFLHESLDDSYGVRHVFALKRPFSGCFLNDFVCLAP